MAHFHITDDGDEVVSIALITDEATTIVNVEHGAHGWDGMTATIDAVETFAAALGIEVVNEQDIV